MSIITVLRICEPLTDRQALLLAVRADDVKRRHRDGRRLLRFLGIDERKLLETPLEVHFLQHSGNRTEPNFELS